MVVLKMLWVFSIVFVIGSDSKTEKYQLDEDPGNFEFIGGLVNTSTDYFPQNNFTVDKISSTKTSYFDSSDINKSSAFDVLKNDDGGVQKQHKKSVKLKTESKNINNDGISHSSNYNEKESVNTEKLKPRNLNVNVQNVVNTTNGNIEHTNIITNMNSLDISLASLEDDAEGSGNDYDNIFKLSDLDSDDYEQGKDVMTTEIWDMETHDSFNTTVEDIFNSPISNLDFPEYEIKKTVPKNDIIERWLTAQKNNLTTHQNDSYESLLKDQFEHNFSGPLVDTHEIDSITYASNVPLDHTENYNTRNTAFPVSSESNTETVHNSQIQKISSDSKVLPTFNEFKQTDSNSEFVNFRNSPILENMDLVVQNETSTNLPSFLQSYKNVFSSEFYNLNESDLKRGKEIIDNNASIPVKTLFIDENDFRSIFKNLPDSFLINKTEIRQKQELNNLSMDNFETKTESTTNNSTRVEFDDIVPTESKRDNQPITVTTVDQSTFTASDTNLKEDISDEKAPTINTFSPGSQDLEERSLYENTPSVSEVVSNASTENNNKLITMNVKFVDLKSFKRSEPSTDAAKVHSTDLTKNEEHINVMTESQIHFPVIVDESTVQSKSFPTDKAVTAEKNIKDISYEPHFYGHVCTYDGTICTSLNLTIKIVVNDTELHLSPNASVEGSSELQHANMLFKWNGVENLYNLSILFNIRCENISCFVDAVYITIRKRLSNEVLKGNDVIEKEVVARRKNLELFKTQLGTMFENDNSEVTLVLKHGITIFLSHVKFSSFKFLNTPGGLAKPSLLRDYYIEVIGSMVGLLLIGSVGFYIFKKWKNQPTIA